MTRILAIEDEAAILENVLEILEIGDFEVHGAKGGEEGINIAKRLKPDLILCDINMPEVDGYTVLMEVRNDPQTSRIPFIFLTAFADKPFRRRGMNMGASDYLTKPFTATDLLDTVDAQLKQHQEREQARQLELENLRTSIILALPHELRTPLTGIITCADLLLMDYENGNVPDPSRAEQMLHIVQKSGIRLQQLIENYLIYSQLEMLRHGGDLQDLLNNEGVDDPATIVADTVQNIVEEASRQVDITVIDDTPTPARVTLENLEKIVTELTNNALKFSDPATPLTLQMGVDDDLFVFELTDQGRGMTPEQIENIGAYMQFDRRIYEQQGMGLGLIIAKRLTELHGGQLFVESEPGVGTQVTVGLALM